MSIFITLLAYSDEILITDSKISILLASLVSGILGYSWLKYVLKKGRPVLIKND
jgi:NhaA family Na+:H+ antiporter